MFPKNRAEKGLRFHLKLQPCYTYFFFVTCFLVYYFLGNLVIVSNFCANKTLEPFGATHAPYQRFIFSSKYRNMLFVCVTIFASTCIPMLMAPLLPDASDNAVLAMLPSTRK